MDGVAAEYAGERQAVQYVMRKDSRNMRIGVILDIDGTLWDSSKEVSESWDIVFQKHPQVGRRCTKEDFMINMGKPMTAFAEYFMPDMPDEERTPILRECEEFENEYLMSHPPVPYPDMPEVLKELSQSVQLFIVSNCQKGYIETFMDCCGVREYITDWKCFGDNMLPKDGNIRLIADKYHLERFFYVGDIFADYEATKKAHGEFIHAAYGFGTIEEDVPRIADITELPGCLENLVPGT